MIKSLSNNKLLTRIFGKSEHCNERQFVQRYLKFCLDTPAILRSAPGILHNTPNRT